MRGIIVMPNYKVEIPNRVTLKAKEDINLVRLWTLFWDRIDSPEHGAISSGLAENLQYLQSRGILSSHRVHGLPRGELSQQVLDTRSISFKELEAKSPGSWALASGPGAWDGPEPEEGRGLRINLVKLLPVPDKDVPLDDVLEFRNRRKSECEALMTYIDECYRSVVYSPDKPLAEHTAAQKIASGAREVLEVTREAGIAHRLYNLVADFNWFASAVAATTSVAYGVAWPNVVGNSILAGASLSTENIKAVINPKKSDGAFRYVAQYHEEVFHGAV